MNCIRTLVQVTVVALVCACATVPKTPVHIEAAPPDLAAIYVFRPAADDTGSFVTPDLSVDGQLVARLKRETYTVIKLAPGNHKFELRTPDSPGSIWNAEADIEASAGNNYFVAIWNQGQTHTRGSTIPVMVGKGIFIPVNIGAYRAPAKVTLEVVPPDIGIDALRGLTLVPASSGPPK